MLQICYYSNGFGALETQMHTKPKENHTLLLKCCKYLIIVMVYALEAQIHTKPKE